MTATSRRQQRPPLTLVGHPHAATDRRPPRRPRSLIDLYRSVDELRDKQLLLARVQEQQHASAAAVRELCSRIIELERQIHHSTDRLALLRSGRFSLVLAIPCWIRLRILREQLWRSRMKLSELFDKQQTLTAAIRRLEDECRYLEVRRVLLQAQLRRHAPHRAPAKARKKIVKKRQRPHRP